MGVDVNGWMTRVDPDRVQDIAVGSVILVGKPLNDSSPVKPGHKHESSVWFVFTEGKAELLDSSYPHGETEDLSWFCRWEVTIVGFNKKYADMHSLQRMNAQQVTLGDLLGASDRTESVETVKSPEVVEFDRVYEEESRAAARHRRRRSGPYRDDEDNERYLK